MPHQRSRTVAYRDRKSTVCTRLPLSSRSRRGRRRRSRPRHDRRARVERSGAVVRTVRPVLLRAPAEFRVREDERRLPPSKLDERVLESDESLRELLEQVRMHTRLVLVRVEPVQRKPQHGHAPGARHDLRCRPHRVAERPLRKLRPKRRTRRESARRVDDVRLHLQIWASAAFPDAAVGCASRGLTRELLGVRERDRARAAAASGRSRSTRSRRLRPQTLPALAHRERAREPALVEILIRIRRGVPDLDGAEMRQLGFA